MSRNLFLTLRLIQEILQFLAASQPFLQEYRRDKALLSNDYVYAFFWLPENVRILRNEHPEIDFQRLLNNFVSCEK
ncbi:CLUMA_CG008393, isoform A [Clunio marinus]|uniref:CLUMA_CG008393, isoform A n=1 Tax=Clunio marinus TaxID=568069 RepID=A0A1J1I3M9_9DIPT|nr:CLUMA_CG008393, isoform A [Clunio marinus]